ncbi:hypothetical protein Q3G72_026091 [Acer saccharum]|nr:hypothetical protein Q3G72_026091 [Acer saccharum]
MGIQHFSHPEHTLNLVESIKESKVRYWAYCDGCLEVMCFPGYVCHECSFCLHKSCAELPPKILHPLHPHPLTFLICDGWDPIICDGCRDLYRSGFIFNCSWCGFNLDPKCASKQDQEHHQTFKELTLLRFYHKHALKLCNIRKSHDMIQCLCCTQIISGSAYCCLQCDFFIHQSCKEIPMEIHHPFHSQHILLTQTATWNAYSRYRSCAACKSSIDSIKIGCNECNFQLHVSCANPNRWACALKHACHEHNMYYFVEDDTTESSDDDTTGSFECNKCHEKCLDDEAFYRCVGCDFNLHFKCIPIPVKFSLLLN